MSQEKKLICERQLPGYKVTLSSNKTLQNDTYVLSATNLKDEIFKRQFSVFQDIPYSAQQIFPSLQDFVKGIENIFNQKSHTELITINNNPSITLKLKISMGKYEFFHHIKIDLIAQNNQYQILNKRISDMEKRLNQFIEGVRKDKLKESQQKKDLPEIELPSKKKQKEDKKVEKEIIKEKQTLKQGKKPETKDLPVIKPFNIEDKKVTINDTDHKIEAFLISKDGNILISVSAHIVKTKLTYVGELNDKQIEEFLFETTRIKNSVQLFQEIKRNAKKQNKQTLKINEKENKLQILINIPSKDRFTTSSNQKEETIFAQIDIRPIKQEHREEKEIEKVQAVSSSKKTLNQSKDFETRSSRSFTQPTRKQNLINDIKSSLVNENKGKRKDAVNYSHDEITKSGRSKKKGSQTRVDEDKISEISFKSKNTVQKLKESKEIKEVKSRKKNKSDDTDGDFSLSFSHPIRSKSKK